MLSSGTTLRTVLSVVVLSSGATRGTVLLCCLLVLLGLQSASEVIYLHVIDGSTRCCDKRIPKLQSVSAIIFLHTLYIVVL